MKIYTLYDRLAETSGPLFDAPTHAVARRGIMQQLQKVYDINDYRLYYIGDYDPVTMEILNVTPKQEIYLIDGDSNETTSQPI